MNHGTPTSSETPAPLDTAGDEPAPYHVARRPWLDPWQWWLWLSGLVGSRYDGLRHFATVKQGVLLRCGQPHVRDLERIRVGHGLKLIVCARGGTRHPLRGRWFRSEKAWCATHGVQLEHMPFSDAATPPADVIDRFVALVREPANRPVLVHCEQGFHRTGILCAAYRVAIDGWPLERAIAEMERLGFQMDRAKRIPLLDALRAWASRNPPHAPLAPTAGSE